MTTFSIANFNQSTKGRLPSTTRRVNVTGKTIRFNRAAMQAFGLENALGAKVHYNSDGQILIKVIEDDAEMERGVLRFNKFFNKNGENNSKSIQIGKILKALPTERASALTRAEMLNVESGVRVMGSNNRALPGNWIAISA